MLSPRRTAARWRIFLLALLALAPGALGLPRARAESPTAPAPTAAEKGWIAVPRGYLASHLVRRSGTPAQTYRVIINIPADPAAKGQILQGCGDEIVDGIAWDFVKTVLRPARRPAQGDRRYQLQLVPVSVTLPGRIPAKLLTVPDEGYNLPSPPYLQDARNRRVEGVCKVRALFPAAGGRPLEVALMESTGDILLDAVAVQWAIFRWTAAKSSEAQGLVVPIRFVMQ